MTDPGPFPLRALVPFAELAEFCGRTRPSAVKKWLQRHGIRYMLDADGRPCTTAKAIDDALHGRRRDQEPNWDFIRNPRRTKGRAKRETK